MGTPEFAVATLRRIMEDGHDVVGVITATDKWGGRGGKKLLKSAVKKYAEDRGLRILQPANLKNKEFVKELRSLNAEIQIVVAFRMLPEVVWDMPPLGTYNLHGSLLPRYRGAAPINWAVINGDHGTGVTAFKLVHAIDEGDIIHQVSIEINNNDTAGSLHDRMMHVGAAAVSESLKTIANGNVVYQTQAGQLATKAPKIFHEDCEIDFNQPAQIIYNFVRGLSPYPTSWMKINNMKLKVFSCEVDRTQHKSDIGSILSDDKTYIKVACNDGFVNLLDVQLAGKKRMPLKDLLNGFKIEPR